MPYRKVTGIGGWVMMPYGNITGADVPGMPGYYYVLTYSYYGVYEGTSIQQRTSSPLPVEASSTQTILQSSDFSSLNINKTYSVGASVVDIFQMIPSARDGSVYVTVVSTGGALPDGLSLRKVPQTTTTQETWQIYGTPTAPGNFTANFDLALINVPDNIISRGGVTCKYTILSGGETAGSGSTGTGSTGATETGATGASTGTSTGTGSTGTPVLKGWLAARADARAGHTICRTNWKDHYIYFSQYLWWIQFYDPTTKALGTLRVMGKDISGVYDFGVAEFQAQDWTIFGDKTAPVIPPWNYPLATSI